MDTGRETERLARQLQTACRQAGISQRGVERRLEWSNGYLSQLIHGGVDLKLDQLFAVLEVIGKSPAAFFGDLYDLVPRSAEEERAARKFADPVSEESIRAIIDEQLDKRLGGGGKGKGKGKG